MHIIRHAKEIIKLANTYNDLSRECKDNLIKKVQSLDDHKLLKTYSKLYRKLWWYRKNEITKNIEKLIEYRDEIHKRDLLSQCDPVPCYTT